MGHSSKNAQAMLRWWYSFTFKVEIKKLLLNYLELLKHAIYCEEQKVPDVLTASMFIGRLVNTKKKK